MILIYTHKTTPRIEYIFKLIFSDILGVSIQFTTNKEKFINSTGAKINYSNNKIKDEIFILPDKLLFEKGINQQNIKVTEWQNDLYPIIQTNESFKIFYQTSPLSNLPFDPFSASFYLVTRYEEYLPFISDEYQRFEAKQSLAYKYNFLDQPIVNQWAILLSEVIKKKYSNFTFPERKFQYISTIDIDNAYAYVHKGIIRTLGAAAKSLLNLNFKDNIKRYNALTGKNKDPYDTYDFLDFIHKKYNINPIYFFLVGKYGKYGKNPSLKNRAFQSLIKNIGKNAEIGIHPSYTSYKKFDVLKEEINGLSGIINKKITKSRQHFLKLSFPETYKNLVKLIKEDYTMGYASTVGFRAGICTPYFFYDITLEKKTNLKIVPFQIMDTALNKYLNLTPEKAIFKIENIIKKVKYVKGTLVTLWHNESLSEQREWENWKFVYEKMMQIVQ